MSAPSLRRLYLGLRGRYHLWSGRRAYRAGRIRTAGRHLDEAISCGQDSFDAYLLLAKIAYRERDMARAADHFQRARGSDPARFALEGFPVDFVKSLRAHPEAVPRIRYRIVIEAQLADESGARRGRRPAGADAARKRRALGDFSSQAEWLRYRDLPAFRPGEGADTDWDAEARKLFED